METVASIDTGKQPVVLAFQETDGSFDYEGVRLLTDDPDKLVPFVDQLLFSLRVLGFKTRPLMIRESAGIAEIEWSGRRPKAFRDRLLLCVSHGEHVDCFQVAAA